MASAEKNYDTSQKELLVVKSVEHFRQFLYGKEFVIKTDHHPLTSITTKSKPCVRLGRWLSELADYQFKIEHKRGADNILADALSRLNLPNDEEENLEYVEKIINFVGLECDSDIEILEFGEMIGATETERGEKGQVPPELNSFEFFAQILSYFEDEANGKLSSEEQSPASLVESSNSIFEINAIKTILLQDDWENKARKASTSTPDRPSGPLLEEMSYEDSTTTYTEKPTSTPDRPSGPLLEERSDINAKELNNIIGTNSSLTSDYQMSDPNLKWLKQIILSRPNINELPKLDKNDPHTIIKRKLLKQLSNLQIKKDLIYFTESLRLKIRKM